MGAQVVLRNAFKRRRGLVLHRSLTLQKERLRGAGRHQAARRAGKARPQGQARGTRLGTGAAGMARAEAHKARCVLRAERRRNGPRGKRRRSGAPQAAGPPDQSEHHKKRRGQQRGQQRSDGRIGQAQGVEHGRPPLGIRTCLHYSNGHGSILSYRGNAGTSPGCLFLRVRQQQRMAHHRTRPPRPGKPLRHDFNLGSDERLAAIEAAKQHMGHTSLNETLRALVDLGLRQCLSEAKLQEVQARVRAERANSEP